MTTITKGAAARIAQAARAMPDIDVRALALKLAERVGLPIDEAKLERLTVADLTLMLSGEETVEPDVDRASIKLAVRHLWGQLDDSDGLPQPEPYADGDLPGSLRVAVASNSGDLLDGHFGSCPRFLIYQVGRETTRLVAIRGTEPTDEAEDKNAARSALIDDCQLVYVQSIGGPAAAKVVRAGVHPIKVPSGGPASETLDRLRAVLDAPPPWLAKVMGVEARSLARFTDAEEA